MNGKQARRLRALSKGDGPRYYGGTMHKYSFHAVNFRTGEKRHLATIPGNTGTKDMRTKADELHGLLRTNPINGKPVEFLWLKGHMTLKAPCHRQGYQVLKREHRDK